MEQEAKITVIVQAWMGSRRLPNKSMLRFHGYPVIEWIFRRAGNARLTNELVFAIPNTKHDDPLALYLKKLGANIFRGSESDLIGRLYHAARKWESEQIVRITADCPLVSGPEIDHLIEFLQAGEFDYAYNHIPVNNKYPDGIGAEMMPFHILERLHKEVENPHDREHVTTYIRSNPNIFQIGTFDPKDPRIFSPDLKLDLDTPQDYEKLLNLNVNIEMEAHEIVAKARELVCA